MKTQSSIITACTLSALLFPYGAKAEALEIFRCSLKDGNSVAILATSKDSVRLDFSNGRSYSSPAQLETDASGAPEYFQAGGWIDESGDCDLQLEIRNASGAGGSLMGGSSIQLGSSTSPRIDCRGYTPAISKCSLGSSLSTTFELKNLLHYEKAD